MKTSISNLAWHPHEDEPMARVVRESGATAVEVAPSKIWSDPAAATSDDAARVRDWWDGQGLGVSALQSLLFGRPDLVLFGSPGARDGLFTYLAHLCELAAGLGASALVFGSPRNRARGDLGVAEALQIAIPFFRRIGNVAASHGVWMCVEPNPIQYGADFVTDIEQAIELVDAVATEGFGLHFDTACVTLGGHDVAAGVRSAGGRIRHFHVSEPDLGPVGSPTGLVDHVGAAAALREIGYAGHISIEMLPLDETDNSAAVAAALRQTIGTYR